MKLIDLKNAAQQTVLPLRLQAYERMVLFIERLNPSSLLVRLHVAGMSAQEMQHVLVNEIKNEYGHNVTQQVYLSQESWAVIVRLKEETIAMINNTAKVLPADAKSVDLSKTILAHLAAMDENPYEVALAVVKADIQQIF
ncbi:hypothetical protein [Pedobacter sp. SYSU D00535]|uniref:DUF7935 family protein n=1 Tax=Pedobacter sp. SYSU D00535 TaxID=2810308 RepID=UPI001F61A91C|nr:hypothetical protein [Pedobacter sp. SYSU D00535]